VSDTLHRGWGSASAGAASGVPGGLRLRGEPGPGDRRVRRRAGSCGARLRAGAGRVHGTVLAG